MLSKMQRCLLLENCTAVLPCQRFSGTNRQITILIFPCLGPRAFQHRIFYYIWHDVLLKTSKIPELKMVIKSNPPCCTPEVPTLRVNEIFKFSVYTDTDGLNFERCFEPTSNRNYIVSSLKPILYHKYHYTSNNLVTMVNMRGNWTCKFHYTYLLYYQYISCNFYFKIMKNPVMGYFTLNGIKQSTNGTSKADKHYEHYNFYDGEQVKISCYSTDDEAYYLRLSYTTTANLTYSTESTPVKMYIKLTAKDDGSFIDCNITDFDSPKVSQIHKLYFKHNKSPPTLGFQVNGLALTVIPLTSNKHSLFCKYQYYNGEKLEILSLKDELRYQQMECVINGNGVPEDLQYFKAKSPWHTSGVKITTTLQNNQVLSLSCEVEVNSPYNLRQKSNIKISLILTPRFVDNRNFITGLSKTNILVEFVKSVDTNVIVYEYTDDEILKLKCYSDYYRGKWIYNSSEVENLEVGNYTLEKYHTNSIYFEILPATLILNANHTNSTIACTSLSNINENRTVYVKLIRRNINNKCTLTCTLANAMNNTKNKIFAGGLFAIVVFIGVLVWAVLSIRKRKTTIQHPDTTCANYENLPKHNQEELPVAIQLSEYATSVPKIGQELYTKPIPKHLRQKNIEPSYVELDINKEVKDVCTTDEDKPQSSQNGAGNSYAQVIYPKGPDISPSVENPPKSNSPSAQTNKNSDEESYVNCTPLTNNYANVFFEERYVNAISNEDSTEPAYCEVNIKK